MATREEFEKQYAPDEEVRHLRQEVARLQSEREQYQTEQGGLRLLFRELGELVDALEPPRIDYRPPRGAKVSTPVTHVAHWTDWHMGAVQKPDEVEGFNEFSPEILRNRILNCVRDQQEWVELHRKNYVINVSHDLVTGDLISGGIHQELLVTNAYPEPKQAIEAGELLAKAIAMKAPHYERVVVDFLTVDNHSRLTKKPQASEAGVNTWNYVVGHHAKLRLRDFKNVDFRIHEKVEHVVDVGGRRYLICHGHTVKGWAGFPYYGIQRLVGREATKRMQRVVRETANRPSVDVAKAIGRLFDRVVMGHWHAPLVSPWYMIGGAATGTTAYDHGEGRDSQPIQCSWLCHPKHGEFDKTDWLLRDDPQEES